MILLIFVLYGTADLQAQKRKNSRKAKNDKELFIPQEAKAKKQGPIINPVRKVLNMFNFSFEMGTGFFDHQQELTDVVLIRTENPIPLLYIIPSADESSPTRPYNGFTNWFNDFRPIAIDQIHSNDLIVRTTSNPIVYENKGSFAPVTLRASVSIKKTDKKHYKTTGERRSLEEDLVRIGGGIGFSKVRYKNIEMTPSNDEEIGRYSMPFLETKQNKIFGSVDVNVYSNLDFTLFVNLEAGTWQFKKEDFNEEVVLYDPFYSVGVTFEKTVSKYFKLYIRPAVELRSYALNNGQIDIPNKMTMFSINIGVLLKYPTYPRNKFKAHHVQMEHVFNGKMYRGRSIFRKQNPRIGQNNEPRKRR